MNVYAWLQRYATQIFYQLYEEKLIECENSGYRSTRNDKRDLDRELWDPWVVFYKKCCEVESMCGRSLKEGVVYIGIASAVISVVILLTSITCLISIATSEEHLNNYPLIAVNFFFGLVAACLSCYQLIISILLLWQGLKENGSIFICSLWYVSHISLLTLYFLLFSAKVVVCSIRKHAISGVFTALTGFIYQGMFIYFAVVVNSYLHSLNQERFL